MLMHSNVKYKYLPLFIAFIMFSFNLFIPLTTVFAEEDDPFRCTYGVYSSEEHGIVESDVDYYTSMNFNGFCEGVYQYYNDIYPNTNFIPFGEFKHYVSSLLNIQFWEDLSNSGYFMNVYCDDDEIIMLFQLQPMDIFPPVKQISYPSETLRRVEFGVLQNTMYYVFDGNSMYYYRPKLIYEESIENSMISRRFRVLSLYGNFSTDEDLINAIRNKTYFGFFSVIKISDVANLTFEFPNSDFSTALPIVVPNAYDNNNILGIVNNKYYSFDGINFSSAFNYDVVLSTFPIWKPRDAECFSAAPYLEGNGYILDRIEILLAGEITFGRDYVHSPIIASNYIDVPIPTLTPTPTAIPQITLYPTPTPYVVETMEGVGQMFSLFTRKYTFNINGVDIGIRPFYLVLACFIVGSIFTMVQGGNKS